MPRREQNTLTSVGVKLAWSSNFLGKTDDNNGLPSCSSPHINICDLSTYKVPLLPITILSTSASAPPSLKEVAAVGPALMRQLAILNLSQTIRDTLLSEALKQGAGPTRLRHCASVHVGASLLSFETRTKPQTFSQPLFPFPSSLFPSRFALCLLPTFIRSLSIIAPSHHCTIAPVHRRFTLAIT